MAIETKRWIEIRDRRDIPRTEEELVELVRCEIQNCGALVEQALAQRRPATVAEVREIERKCAKEVITLVREKP